MKEIEYCDDCGTPLVFVGMQQPCMEEWDCPVCTLKSKCKQLQADADRYQYIKSSSSGRSPHMAGYFRSFHLPAIYWEGKTLDEAVDKAMGQHQQIKQP